MMVTDHKRPRILFVNYTAGISGPTHSLMAVLPFLKHKYEVSVFLHEEGFLSHWLAEQHIPTFIIPDLSLASVFKIYRLLRREKIDLVYGNNPSGTSRKAILASWLAGIPFIWHFRGVKWHWGWRKGIFLRLVNRVVAVSEACAQSLDRFYPAEKIHVIYNGVDLPAFDVDRTGGHQYLTDLLGLPADAQFLIHVSHVMPRKGQESAVAVMKQLVEQNPHVHLVIAGSLDRDPAYTQLIRALIHKENLENHVHLLGMRDDIPQLLASADVFLHTARVDAHPRAVIEAMAVELPVVGFAVDGVAETVEDGVTGCLVPPGDIEKMAATIHDLLQAPDLIHRMGQAGLQRVREHFTADGTAAKIEQLIGELLDSG